MRSLKTLLAMDFGKTSPCNMKSPQLSNRKREPIVAMCLELHFDFPTEMLNDRCNIFAKISTWSKLLYLTISIRSFKNCLKIQNRL